MCKKVLPVVFGLLALVGIALFAWKAARPAPRPVTLVSVSGLDPSKKLTLIALQGLINRGGPCVFLDFGSDNRWMKMDYTENPGQEDKRSWNPDTPDDFKIKYPTIARAWIRILEDRSLFEFHPRTWTWFLADAGKKAGGWIVYDSFDDEVALVGTLAGQMDALPVKRGDLEAMREILPGLPVVFDVKTIPTPEHVSRKVAVHRWMIENILPRVSKSGLVSRVKNYNLEEHDTYVDIDQAVQEKWMVYDLTHYRADVADKPEPKLERPDETVVLKQLLENYPPMTPVFGWGAANENTFVRTITEMGLVVICSGVPNHSFFNRWKPSEPRLRQKRPDSPAVAPQVEDKIYLAIMVNEGDSAKNMSALQGHGAWLQPERGAVPMNWGVDPLLCERFPGMMEYFYQTATPNDGFFAAASGWGYTHPVRMNPAMARSYVEQVNKGLKLADVEYADIWWMPRSGPVWQEFATGMKAKGLTQWCNPEQKIGFSEAGFPVAYSNHYYTMNDPADFARRLVEDYKDMRGPWFVVVYGANRHMTPYKAKALMDHLPAERFKAVLLDEFFTCARLARKSVEGRVWRPGASAVKGVAP